VTRAASLGHLVVDNRASGRPIDRSERELLEMLAEYLAVAIRKLAALYGDRHHQALARTAHRLRGLTRSSRWTVTTGWEGWNPAAEAHLRV